MATDAQLLAKISSDATGEALRALYRSYAGELYGFALNALGDRGTAEDVVQEVFTRAWRDAEDPEGLSIERAMLGWQVAGALEKLTPEHRQVIRLAHVQGFAVREIA